MAGLFSQLKTKNNTDENKSGGLFTKLAKQQEETARKTSIANFRKLDPEPIQAPLSTADFRRLDPVSAAPNKIPYAETYKEVPKNFASGNVLGGVGNALKGTGQMVLQGLSGPQKLIQTIPKGIQTGDWMPDPNLTTEEYVRKVAPDYSDKLLNTSGGQFATGLFNIASDPLAWVGGGIADDALKATVKGTQGLVRDAKMGENILSKQLPKATKTEPVIKPLNDNLAAKSTNNINTQPTLPKQITAANRNIAEDIGLKGNNTIETLTLKPEMSQKGTAALVNKDGKPLSQFAQTVADSKNTTTQLSKDLKELDLGYDKVTNQKSLEQANARISTNPEQAVRYVLDTKEPSAEHTATAIQLINKFQKEGNYERAVDIASDISSKLTKNGQAIQAASIYDRLSPEGILLYAQRQVNKLNDSRWFKGLTKEQKIDPNLAKELQDLSKKMQGLTGDAKIEASQELQQALQALGKSTVGRKIESAQTIGQLLNTKTLVRNTIGNELFYRLERFNKYIATPIDIARSAITGADRTVTFKTAGQSGYWEGFLKGAKAGWKGVNPAGLQTQFDLTAPAFKAKWNPLTYMEKALGATLKGFDFAAYTRAVNKTIGEMAELKAINQGLKGEVRKSAVKEFAKTSEKNILDIADQYGKYITFQDDNVLSKGLSAVKRGLNAGKDFGAGSLIIKYPKTPGALIMRGLEYSPAGFLKSAYEIAKPLLKGGKIDTREATMALSRAITGTLGFTGLGYYLADNGVITGRTDSDRDVRDLQKQTGAGSYKINISALKRWAMNGFNTADLKLRDGDTLYSYDWAQPIAMAISFGANINANLKESEGAFDNLGATAAASIEGALGTIAEQPVLQGIARQFQGYDLGQNAIQTLQGIPSSFTPTALNQARQLMDNTGRSTYNPDPLKEALNMAQVKVPGKSGNLPANFDTLGRQKENYQNGSNSVFNVLFNPGFVSKNNPTPVQKEILRLYEATGSKTQFPRVVSDKITYTIKGDSKSYTFTQEEKPLYQKAVGELVQSGISNLMSAPGYKLSTDENKVKMIYNVLNNSSEKAKNDFLKSKGLK